MVTHRCMGNVVVVVVVGTLSIELAPWKAHGYPPLSYSHL